MEMAKKEEMVQIPKTPKPPWEKYDPLSKEVYGEPFDVELPKAPPMDVEAIPDALETSIEGNVDAPPEEEMPTIKESSVEEVPVFEDISDPGEAATSDDRAAVPQNNSPKRVVRRRKAVAATDGDVEQVPTGKATAKRVVRRKKSV